MRNLQPARLYTFVDTAYLRGRSPATVLRQLCDGGSDLVQLRAKDWSKEHIRRTAEELAPLAQQAGVDLVINDHLDIAREVGAACCHLGQEDFFDTGHTHVSQLHRGQPPVGMGLSTHAPAQALRAVAAGPDYVAIGPVYPTGTKPTAKPVTLEYVRWAAENLALPWFAIGGITLENLEEVLAAGASRVCVVSAILQEDDLAAACRRFRHVLDRSRR